MISRTACSYFASDLHIKDFRARNLRTIALPKKFARVLSAVLLLASLAAAQQYNLVDLGTLGGNVATAYGINKFGDATGFSYSTGGGCYLQAFLYTDGAGMQDVGLLPGWGGCNYGVSINDNGQIAFNGDHHPGSGDYTAHRYTPNVGAIDLGTLPGDVVSYAARIDASGNVVGGSVTNDPPNYLFGDPFYYSDGTGMVDLGNLGGRGQANGINSAGVIVGYSRTPTTPVGDYWNIGHAFVYRSDGGIVDLNTLTLTKGWTLYNAASISKQGFIVGYGLHKTKKIDVLDAYRYNPVTHFITDLGTFPGGGISYAADINSKGWIVGTAYLDASGAGNFRAAVWPKGKPGALNLNNLIPQDSGWTLAQATAINDAGQILAWGVDANGDTHAFRLDPVN
jgi:probable HAF family extracellular repeat protein